LVSALMASDALPTDAPLIGAASAEIPARPIAVVVRIVNKILRIVVSSFAVQAGKAPTLSRWPPNRPGSVRVSAVMDATSRPPPHPSTVLPCLMMLVAKEARDQQQGLSRRIRIESMFC
jgi:hypothetical protein